MSECEYEWVNARLQSFEQKRYINILFTMYACVCSLRVAPVAASPGYLGFAWLPHHSPIPAKEEEAERQPDQPEDSEREPQSGQRDRHRGPKQCKCVLLSLLALQNCKLMASSLERSQLDSAALCRTRTAF